VRTDTAGDTTGGPLAARASPKSGCAERLASQYGPYADLRGAARPRRPRGPAAVGVRRAGGSHEQKGSGKAAGRRASAGRRRDPGPVNCSRLGMVRYLLIAGSGSGRTWSAAWPAYGRARASSSRRTGGRAGADAHRDRDRDRFSGVVGAERQSSKGVVTVVVGTFGLVAWVIPLLLPGLFASRAARKRPRRTADLIGGTALLLGVTGLEPSTRAPRAEHRECVAACATPGSDRLRHGLAAGGRADQYIALALLGLLSTFGILVVTATPVRASGSDALAGRVRDGGWMRRPRRRATRRRQAATARRSRAARQRAAPPRHSWAGADSRWRGRDRLHPDVATVLERLRSTAR
jgi:S-DNA-T family DNA segregation ATPase FtsK/SpoIIIE